MTTNCFARTVAYAYVQMLTVDAHGSCKRNDFKIAVFFGAFGLIGITNICLGKTANAGYYPAGFYVFFGYIFFNFLFKSWPGISLKA
jgi:hypothetical protein